MRMRTYSRTLKTTSAITLAFFLWSFGPIWQAVAFAATKEGQGAGGAGVRSSEFGVRSETQKIATTSGRFEKALDEIREKISRAEEKDLKNQDITTEITEVKKRRAEIDSLDVELKKEFAVTEKKLRNASLPKEILDRHYKFVKHYEDNLNELKANLAGIEQGAESKGFKEANQRTKLHLEKIKPPKKHVPLDPNKLPHRMVKGKERAPRLKKEEFEKDFPPQKKGSKLASLQAILAANELKWTRIKHKPVLLAFNGPTSDIPFQLPLPSENNLPLSAAGEGWGEGAIPSFDTLSATTYEPRAILLAQATVTPPTADDLSETPEVQFTPDIQALATQLNHSPVKIYEWVRNNIEFVPTYGSIQGAQMTLETKMGNSFDTASLLIALLRASGISARYVYGTVEIPIEKAMNWVGGVTDPKMAGTVFATNGVPAKVVISGSTIKVVQLEHVWVKAFVDYIPSRGAVHKQGDTWVPLDASYKQYNYTQGMAINSAVLFDAQTFVNQLQSTATINEAEGYVTNVNSLLIQQTMQNYQTQVQNYIQQNHPSATVGDVIGKKEIIKHEFPYLMGTLPYKTVQSGSDFALVPANLRATMSFSIPDPTGLGTGLSYSTSLPQIAGKKTTLSFSSASDADQKVVESYFPKPHADGTPLQLSELPSSFPAYLINLKSELRIDGQIVATGASVTMGQALSFTISLNEPGTGQSQINNVVLAGEYYGIGVDTGGVGNLDTLKAKLETTMTKIETQNYDGLTKDDLVGDLLYTTIASYFAELDMNDEITAKKMDVVRYRAPSIGMFLLKLNVRDVFGIPTSAGSTGMMMDVDRVMQAVFSKDGNMDKVKGYMQTSGMISSALEHSVPEMFYSTADNPVNAISAVKALKIANDQGIAVYTINKSNINTVLPQLQVSGEVITDIITAVNAGKIVTVSKSNINFNGWVGCGYIILDPVSGAGAYMISAGTNGAIILLLLCLAILAIAVAIGPIALAIVSLLLPIFAAGLFWIAYKSSDSFRNCAAAVLISVLSVWGAVYLLFPAPAIALSFSRLLWGQALQRLVVSPSISRIGRECFGHGVAY